MMIGQTLNHTMNTKFLHQLNNVDEVWCPSTFIQQAIQNSEGYKNNTIPIRVLPLPQEQKEDIVVKEGESKSTLLHQILDSSAKIKPFVFWLHLTFTASFRVRTHRHP